MKDSTYKVTGARTTGKKATAKAEEDPPDFTHDHATNRVENMILQFAEYDADGNETKPAVMDGPYVMERDLTASPEDPDKPTPPELTKVDPPPQTIVWM